MGNCFIGSLGRRFWGNVYRAFGREFLGKCLGCRVLEGDITNRVLEEGELLRSFASSSCLLRFGGIEAEISSRLDGGF